MNQPRVMNVDELIVHYEPAVTRAQFQAAARHLEDRLDELIRRDGCQAARSLIEKMHLIAGDRRKKSIAINVERRGVSS